MSRKSRANSRARSKAKRLAKQDPAAALRAIAANGNAARLAKLAAPVTGVKPSDPVEPVRVAPGEGTDDWRNDRKGR